MQQFASNLYEAGHTGQTDLQNIENALLTLKSMFSGSSAPSDPVDGMPWYDTDTHAVKIRKDGAWVGLFAGNASFKIWAYLDAAQDGWTRDSGVTDKVLSLKGGSTYTTGADDTQGTWSMGLTIANENAHTHSHNHDLAYNGSNQSSRTSSDPIAEVISHASYTVGSLRTNSGSGGTATLRDVMANTDTDATAGSAHTHTGSTVTSTSRPAAACGILVYPNLT